MTSTQPIAAATIVTSRVTLRCARCRLVQYQTPRNRCRACWRTLVEPEPEPLPAATVGSQRRAHEGAAWVRTRLALAVRDWRVTRGLTQEQLGERVGLHRTNVSRVEAEFLTPMPQQAERLAAGLGVPLSVLLAKTADRRYLIELVSAGAGRLTGARRRQVLDQAAVCRSM